jgi:hypothetical protein
MKPGDFTKFMMKIDALQRFHDLMKSPELAFERRRAAMLVTMIRSVAYKDTPVMGEGPGPAEYLVERGFTLLEVKDLLPSCRVLMTQLYLDHPEIFKAIAEHRQKEGERDAPLNS